MFPDKFNDSFKFNVLEQTANKAIAQLKYILTGDKIHLNGIEMVNRYFMTLLEPKNLDWSSGQNVIVQARKSYEELCVILIQLNFQNPGKLPVMKFYTAISYYEKTKAKSKSRNGRPLRGPGV